MEKCQHVNVSSSFELGGAWSSIETVTCDACRKILARYEVIAGARVRELAINIQLTERGVKEMENCQHQNVTSLFSPRGVDWAIETVVCNDCGEVLEHWLLKDGIRFEKEGPNGLSGLNKVYKTESGVCWCTRKLKQGKCPRRRDTWHAEIDTKLKKPCWCGRKRGVIHGLGLEYPLDICYVACELDEVDPNHSLMKRIIDFEKELKIIFQNFKGLEETIIYRCGKGVRPTPLLKTNPIKGGEKNAKSMLV